MATSQCVYHCTYCLNVIGTDVDPVDPVDHGITVADMSAWGFTAPGNNHSSINTAIFGVLMTILGISHLSIL